MVKWDRRYVLSFMHVVWFVSVSAMWGLAVNALGAVVEGFSRFSGWRDILSEERRAVVSTSQGVRLSHDDPGTLHMGQE